MKVVVFYIGICNLFSSLIYVYVSAHFCSSVVMSAVKSALSFLLRRRRREKGRKLCALLIYGIAPLRSFQTILGQVAWFKMDVRQPCTLWGWGFSWIFICTIGSLSLPLVCSLLHIWDQGRCCSQQSRRSFIADGWGWRWRSIRAYALAAAVWTEKR